MVFLLKVWSYHKQKRLLHNCFQSNNSLSAELFYMLADFIQHISYRSIRQQIHKRKFHYDKMIADPVIN